MSTTYKLVIPANVEEKIRYLQRKFPHTEWSGVLFTSHKGSFEGNDLVITCHDIYPMDLGNSTYTEYKMDENVAGYMADNVDLFYCDLSQIHSHHCMAAYFSGTDLATLREEGNEKNCFVSLIVNNEGTYCAAITRKIKSKTEVTTKSLGTSYEFFGDGSIATGEQSELAVTQVIDREVIEYYMLDIEKEEVENPLAYLDERFDEIEKKKKEEKDKVKSTSVYPIGKSEWNFWEDDKSFEDWRKEKHSFPEVKEQFLFDDKTMKEMEVTPQVQFQKETIQSLLAKMLTCSLLVNTDNFNMEYWIKQFMVDKYSNLFAVPGTFDAWCDFIVDFLITNFYDDEIPEEVYYDPDEFQSQLAKALHEELSVYKGLNDYIDDYLNTIDRYIL